MIIFGNFLNLKSKQDDVATMFLDANVRGDKQVYVEMLLSFKNYSSNGKYKIFYLENSQ